MKRIFYVLVLLLIIGSFTACGKQDEQPFAENKSELSGDSMPNSAVSADTTEANADQTTDQSTTTETTTETTTAETTTKPDGSSVKAIVKTLESKHFYMAGTMNLTDGKTMQAKATCEGDNSRIDISSAMMNMSMIYLDGVPYLVNASTNSYAVLDESAYNNLDKLLGSMSSYGVSFSNSEISEMKNMMGDFDSTIDYSQYIENGEYNEYDFTIDGEEYLVSEYVTDYGKIRIYTQSGELKIIDVFDTSGLRQMNFEVSAFIPQVLTPVSLTGLTKAASVLDLFSVR